MAKVHYVELSKVRQSSGESEFYRIEVQIETPDGKLFVVRGESGITKEKSASAIRHLVHNLLNDHELLKAL